MKQTTIKCGWLVSMDDRIGDLKDAEILVRDSRIVAVGHDLGATSDEVIDAGDMIVMPGLVNAHIHLWQCGLRGIGSEWAVGEYFVHIHGNLATHYGPEDNYLGNLIGSLTQIDGGVTTALDWCHNLKSLEQAERSIDALEETGLRTVFAHGTTKPPTPPDGPPYSQIPHPRERVEALRKGRLASDHGRVTLAMAILGPHYSTWDVVVQDLALAREFNLLSTAHATRRKQDCVTPNGYLRLAQEGLIGPEHNIVHANFFEDDELKAVVEASASVTPTVLVELHSDYADPLVPRLRALGALPSIGNDVEPIVSGDMFREMQAALLHARQVANRDNRQAGGAPFRISPVRSREALQWATIGGARALRLENRVGSLTPGKKADIIMLRSTDLNLFPVHNPLYSIVEQANAGNVDTVMIDGIIRKQAGRLTFPVDVLRQRQGELAASAERIMRAGDFTVLAA